MRVKVGGKAIPASFLNVEGRRTLVAVKDQRERDRQKNWYVVRTQVLNHLPGAGKSKRGGSKGDVRGKATTRGAMEKGRCQGH